MKVTFLSNYLTPHQIPFSNEMYQLLGKDYTFIATQEMEAFRKEQGWDQKEQYPYEFISLAGDTFSHKEADRIIGDSNIIISGSAPEAYINKRIEMNSDVLILRYRERIYKNGRWHCISPKSLRLTWDTYYRYPKKNIFMLCSGAYTYGDLMLHGAYSGKCYKWGYFPKNFIYNLDELMAQKRNLRTELLWCARMIDCKHPEVVVNLAKWLKDEYLDFHLNMIGSGEKESLIRSMLHEHRLEDNVTLLGALPNDEVLNYMKKANIFLFTSDYKEGWGAVVNEAMNSGCAVIASHAAGAVPFLIKDQVNGIIYRYENPDSLYQKVKALLQSKTLCEKVGREAYRTITTEWNAKEAAQRLLILAQDLINQGYCDKFLSGPCSKAKIIGNHWYKDNALRSIQEDDRNR